MSKFKRRPHEIEAITFDELVKHGIASGASLTNGMPWSFDYKGHPITHENDQCYLIPTPQGTMKFTPSHMLITGGGGEIYPCDADWLEENYEPHEPFAAESELSRIDAVLARRPALGHLSSRVEMVQFACDTAARQVEEICDLKQQLLHKKRTVIAECLEYFHQGKGDSTLCAAPVHCGCREKIAGAIRDLK